MTTDILIVGNYSHDLLDIGGETHLTLGGPPAYMAALFEGFGTPYDVVSKVGRDFLFNSTVYKVPIYTHSPTATIRHWFVGGKRESRMIHGGQQILHGNINTYCKIGIVAGHVGEITPETLNVLRRRSQLLLVDIQSLIRRFDSEGYMTLDDLMATQFSKLIRHIDILKASEEEAQFANIRHRSWPGTLVVTLGPKGCRIHSGSAVTTIETQPIEEVDATGAGDMFLAGLALGLWNKLGIRDAARIANQCGSLAVKTLGVPVVNSEDVKRIIGNVSAIIQS